MAKRRAEAKWNEKEQRWRISVQSEGERKVCYSSIKGKAGKHDAESKADDWLNDRTNDNMKFSKVWEQFQRDRFPFLADNTKRSYISTVKNHILPYVGNKMIGSITEYDYQKCIDRAYRNGINGNCELIRVAIGLIVSYARKRRIPLLDKHLELTTPKKYKINPTTIIQPNDLKKLLTNTSYDPMLTNLFKVTVILGLRRGEVCGLKWSDIETNEGISVVHVARAVDQCCQIITPKTDDSIRTIVLPDMAVEILKEQKEFLRSKLILSEWIFPEPNGEVKSPARLYRQWQAFCKQAGIPKTKFHSLRHTMVSINKDSMSEFVLKKIVGHSASMDTLGVYGKLVDGDLEQGAKSMNEQLSNIINM